MIDQTTIRTAASAIAALDLSAENGRIAELGAEIGRMETAAETGLTRMEEVVATIAEREGPNGSRNLDPGAVADALFASLDTVAAIKASPTVEELAGERDALRSGVAELRSRIRQATEEIDRIRREANRRAAATIAPLLDVIGEEARAAADRIVAAYAAIEAIGFATKSLPADGRAVRAAMGGLTADYGLVTRGDAIDVPAEVVALLAPLAGKGAALRPALVRSIAR